MASSFYLIGVCIERGSQSCLAGKTPLSHFLKIFCTNASTEKRPGPVKNMRENITRYISASSFVANGSSAWTINVATAIVIIIGMRHRR